MTREEATRILDEVIPPPEHHTVDLDHLPIAQAWLCIKKTLTAELVKHGRWVHHTAWESDGECAYECSVCGMGSDVDYDFCPKCGADMRGEQE